MVFTLAYLATTWRSRAQAAAIAFGGAVAVALVANWLRVAGTGMMAELYGREAAEGLTHIVWGKIVYGAMLVPFALLVLALRRRP
jgi:exosortase/archaeosortase family protein